MDTKSIKQTVWINASPHEIFELLTDSEKHSSLTKSKAEIDPKVGGAFSVYGGGLHGTFIEIVPDRKLVMNWRANEASWPSNHFSRVTMDFFPERGGTTIEFNQSEVPLSAYDHIEKGWVTYYWEPIRRMFPS